MKFKEIFTRVVQEVLKEIAIETVGRSIPWGLYEKEIDVKLAEEIEKQRRANNI